MTDTSVYRNSKMSSLYYSKDQADENSPCVVTITDSEILVEYDQDGLVQYRGKNQGNGHFILRADGFGGRATLHMFSGAKILEGHRIEGSLRGMWRLDLA